MDDLTDRNSMSPSEDEELDHLSKLRAPLDNGWRRETIIRGLSKNLQILGDVCYYAPKSQTMLTDIGQIQKVR